ncbi:uncharacterized protein LOC126769283 [Nymphalis io]|uniref:uncharacterized protein LOC126769283 n=1 Tax=Inachis io TaxID=171585 RepID=UPI0021680955|nr:uncharacterized protein LOC126769283 [Nymphalis io]
MKIFNLIWKKITDTDALESASGNLELKFYELIYRVTYIFGLSTSDYSVAYWIYSTAVKTLLVLLVCCEFWNFFSITWNIEEVIDGINIILIQLGAFYKYRVLISNKHVFKSLASSMQSGNFDLSTERRKNILETWQARNEAWLKLLLGIGTCTVVVWHIYPLMDELEYNLMVSIRLPFDFKTPVRYTITYVITMIAFSLISYFVMTNDLTVQVHLMYILCQFSILNDCFKNILTDCQSCFKDIDTENLHLYKEFTQVYKRRLGNLADQHKLILRNTLKLRDIMSLSMLIQLATSTTLMCSISFQLTTSVNVNMTKGLMSLFYLGYNMFVLYTICRWCEEIKIQSESISEAVYCSRWEHGIVMVPGVRTSILLIMARAQKPTGLSAGGMYELSLEAYTNMVKTSYSALTILLRLR